MIHASRSPCIATVAIAAWPSEMPPSFEGTQLRDLLVSTQHTKGALAGSWNPVDQREKPGGRLYSTVLRLLMLEVYYRHLPLYQQLEK
jgi:hypothetical protein